MKEYKTLRVTPEDESETITQCAVFGWRLEDTREVYNETQEIVGIKENVTSYGSFMRGFTGNDGKVESEVQTKTKVTHYLSMRFSREKSLKDYDRLVELEREYYEPTEPEYAQLKDLIPVGKPVHLKKPIVGTVLNAIVLITAIVAVMADWAIAVIVAAAVVAFIWTVATVSAWVRYVKIHPNEDAINADIEEKNKIAAAENESIMRENKLIEEQNAKLKYEFETHEALLKEAREILLLNGIDL